MEHYHERIPRKGKFSGLVLEANAFEERLRLAATIYSLLYTADSRLPQTPAYAPHHLNAVHQQKPSILEELVSDRNALRHYHLCTGYQREAYLDLYRGFLLLKCQAPHLVTRLSEKRSLNDLSFWQQLGWILNEQSYLGQPLDGFAQLPQEHRKIAALYSCELIVERMREDNAPFHAVMKEWGTIFDSIRDLFQTATRLTSRAARHQAANFG